MPSEASASGLPPGRATAIIALGTLASLVLGVIANKVYAVVLGPPGVGVMALIMSTIAVGAIAAGLGMGTSVVQLISSARASGDTSYGRATERVARRITLVACVVLALALILWKDALATWVFGTPAAGVYVLFIGPAIVFTGMAFLETGILTGHQRIRGIALANAYAAAVGMVAGVVAVLSVGLAGLAPAFMASAAAHYIYVRWRTLRIHVPVRPMPAPPDVTSRLLRLGAPACLSQLVLVGAQLAIPVLILHALGAHEVGLYRAASTISIAYLTLALSTLTYEFLPRITRVQTGEVGAAIDQHMRLLLGAAVPMILVIFSLGPLILELLFSDAFVPAMSVLQWQLVGDLLRIPAWALAFALISQARSGMYLGVEVVAGLSLIVAVPIGLLFGGLEGVGVGYAVAQAVYLGVAWVVTARLGLTAPGRLQAIVILIAFGVSTSIVIGMPLVPRGIIFGTLAASAAVIAVPRLFALYRARAT